MSGERNSSQRKKIAEQETMLDSLFAQPDQRAVVPPLRAFKRYDQAKKRLVVGQLFKEGYQIAPRIVLQRISDMISALNGLKNDQQDKVLKILVDQLRPLFRQGILDRRAALNYVKLLLLGEMGPAKINSGGSIRQRKFYPNIAQTIERQLDGMDENSLVPRQYRQNIFTLRDRPQQSYQNADRIREIYKDRNIDYRLKPYQAVSAFPNWVSRNDRRITKGFAQKMQSYNNALNIQEQTNPLYSSLNRLGVVQWRNDRWTGPYVDKKLNAAEKASQNHQQRLATAKALLNSKLTSEEVQAQVPPLIKELIAANEALSTSGFGPISQNGSSLYAGRWLDPSTGRVRVLPTASQKYLNPISAPQKVGYYQARMINFWNQLVSSFQATQKWSKDGAAAKLQQQTWRSIKNGLNIEMDEMVYANFINSTIINMFSNPLEGGSINVNTKMLGLKDAILRSAPTGSLEFIFNIGPQKVTQSWLSDQVTEQDSIKRQQAYERQRANDIRLIASFKSFGDAKDQITTQMQLSGTKPSSLIRYKIALWENAVQIGTNTLRQKVKGLQKKDKNNYYQYEKLLANIDQAMFSLVGVAERKVQRAMIKLQKVAFLPLKPTSVSQVMNEGERVDATIQRMRSITGKTLSSQKNYEVLRKFRKTALYTDLSKPEKLSDFRTAFSNAFNSLNFTRKHPMMLEGVKTVKPIKSEAQRRAAMLGVQYDPDNRPSAAYITGLLDSLPKPRRQQRLGGDRPAGEGGDGRDAPVDVDAE